MSRPDYTQSETEATRSSRDSKEETEANQAGIGLVATDEHSEAVASSILRAQRYGHQVFVTYPDDPENEGVRFARQLGATIINPTQTRHTETGDYRQLLVGAAEVSECTGLIFVPEPERRIDFEQSVAELNGQTVCNAVYEAEPSQSASSAVAIGIPAYNEANTIAQVVAEAREYADTILVVDDGSDDQTPELAREAGATVIEHAVNQGYGAALQTLFTEADNLDVEHLAVIDADGQHDPSDVPAMVETQQESGAELVIGSRFVDGGQTDAPLYRRFGLGVVNVLTNLSMGVIRPSSAVSDTQCGFRVYEEKAIASLADDDSLGEGMGASTDILYHAHSKNFAIEEVGTNVSYDVEGTSSRNPLSHGIALVSNILKTIEKERPILLLGIPGLISILIGTGFSYWTVTNFINTGKFPLGLALLAATFGLAGLFASFTSMVLHSLNHHLD